MSTMDQAPQTMEDVAQSLTGFDEIAIAQQFGRTVTDLGQNDATMFARALVFIIKRRDGATDEEAKNAALEMSLKDSAAVFATPSEEESGKDEQPEEQPGTSLSSVS
jgi:hypothetical protein